MAYDRRITDIARIAAIAAGKNASVAPQLLMPDITFTIVDAVEDGRLILGVAASGMSAGTAKTPQAVEGEARQPGPGGETPKPLFSKDSPMTEQRARELLEPCPFCGAEAKFIADDSYGGCGVGCLSGCEAEPYCSADKEEPEKAITAWNTRIEATPAVDREAAREAIARKLCEQHGGDPDAVAREEHDCWDGPLWTVFLKDADAIMALPPVKQSDGLAERVREACVAEAEKAIRAHSDTHGPSGGAWNISMMLGAVLPAIRSLDITRMDSDG